MAIEIKLPNLGDGVDSGDVLEVLVKVGDVISKDQGIVELETDKATVEVPSSHGGRVLEIHVKEGDTVATDGLILSLEEAAGAPAPSAPPAETPPPAEPAPPVEKSPEVPPPAPAPAEPTAAPPTPAQPSAPVPPKPAPAVVPASPAPAASASSDTETEIAAGPAIRRFAREVGVDLGRVEGSGPGGRITRDDVLKVVRHASQAVQNGTHEVETGERDEFGLVQYERASKIRRTIAEKMDASWQTVPRVTNFDDADVTELEAIRQASKLDYQDKGIKLTTMPFIIKAVASSLTQHPMINAALDLENNRIVYKQYVNIGIAVDTERGLVVPVLRNANELSIPEIARRLGSIASQVREGDFGVEDLRGGTFTISNLGAIGGTYSTPIVNVPEVAILLIGRSRKMPVVHNDEVKVRLMMPLSLSYDHRLVDGGSAARFLNDIISYLQTPSRMLLAP